MVIAFGGIKKTASGWGLLTGDVGVVIPRGQRFYKIGDFNRFYFTKDNEKCSMDISNKGIM